MGRKASKVKGGRNRNKANKDNRNTRNAKNASAESKAAPPNFLNFLNRSLVFRMLVCLGEEERVQLGVAFPRFRVAKNQQAEPPSSEKQQQTSSDSKAAFFIPEDPHTLLARLNSKRLHRRIGHLRKQNPEVDLKHAYVLNKTTEQIAIAEWQGLMAEYNKKVVPHKDPIKQVEEQLKEEESPKVASSLPSPLELLLFSPCPRAVAVLASYPRSGNSLLRTLYERTTLRVTGSDMRGGLTKHDLVGEAATEQNAVQFVKTHYPERRGTVSGPV